ATTVSQHHWYRMSCRNFHRRYQGTRSPRRTGAQRGRTGTQPSGSSKGRIFGHRQFDPIPWNALSIRHRKRPDASQTTRTNQNVKGMDCIFCKIVRKELPSYMVFEDENFIAFLDIRPLNPGHTLVSPKKHHRWVWDVPDAGRYFETVRMIPKTLQTTVHPERVLAAPGGI